jgi:hypothetical protein
MSHRPAQQTEEDERAWLISELYMLACASLEATGHLPQFIEELTHKDSGAIDFGLVSDARLGELCAALRAECAGEHTAN